MNEETHVESTTNEPRIELWEEKNINLLVLNPQSKWPLKLGLGKCKLILEEQNLEAIRAFVASEGQSL